MKPLDNVYEWIAKSSDESFEPEVLDEHEKILWNSFSGKHRKEFTEKLLTEPLDLEGPEIFYSWYFRSKWIQALKSVLPTDSIRVLEIGAGCADMLPRAMSCAYTHPQTKYITANMNKELTAAFKQKTSSLPIQVDVIEDNAQNIEAHAETGLFDAVVFEHSVNDVIETMLAERNGINTTESDWMQILPDMISLVNKEIKNKTFVQSVRDDLLDLFKSCLAVLKPGGFIIINHYEFQCNLDFGIDPEWWENLVPIVRGWITEAKLGQEIFPKDFDTQWWMFIKKI